MCYFRLSTFHLNFRPTIIIFILLYFKVWKFSICFNFSYTYMHVKMLIFLYQSVGSFSVNSTSESQVSVSNNAKIIPKITTRPTFGSVTSM